MNVSYIKAGLLSSLLEVCYSHPLDVLKTYHQNKTPIRFNSMFFNTMRQSIGIRMFGIVPARMNFWLGQEFAKQYTHKIIPLAISGAFFQTIIESPVENIKYSKIYNYPMSAI